MSREPSFHFESGRPVVRIDARHADEFVTFIRDCGIVSGEYQLEIAYRDLDGPASGDVALIHFGPCDDIAEIEAQVEECIRLWKSEKRGGPDIG